MEGPVDGNELHFHRHGEISTPADLLKNDVLDAKQSLSPNTENSRDIVVLVRYIKFK